MNGSAGGQVPDAADPEGDQSLTRLPLKIRILKRLNRELSIIVEDDTGGGIGPGNGATRTGARERDREAFVALQNAVAADKNRDRGNTAAGRERHRSTGKRTTKILSAGWVGAISGDLPRCRQRCIEIALAQHGEAMLTAAAVAFRLRAGVPTKSDVCIDAQVAVIVGDHRLRDVGVGIESAPFTWIPETDHKMLVRLEQAVGLHRDGESGAEHPRSQ